MDRDFIEQQLRKRLDFPYKWGRLQNNAWDARTNFIYDIQDFDKIIARIENDFARDPEYSSLLNYALNRWYNFWSSRAVEDIFCSLDRVAPSPNPKDRFIDFRIDGIEFDHKTSIFPKNYSRSFEFAFNQPRDLIVWLYRNQSQQQRKHLKNRLFIVLYSSDGEHWKLKSDISLLESLIRPYIQNFSVGTLHKISFEQGESALSDIIWARK